MRQKSFIWGQYKLWRESILKLLGDYIDGRVFRYLRDNPPEYFVADNLGWLDKAIRETVNPAAPDIAQILMKRLPERYPYVRGFHGCRTTSLDPYKSLGLVPSDPQVLNQLARS